MCFKYVDERKENTLKGQIRNCVSERERQRERETERERETDRQTDRQRERETDRQRENYEQRQKGVFISSHFFITFCRVPPPPTPSFC